MKGLTIASIIFAFLFSPVLAVNSGEITLENPNELTIQYSKEIDKLKGNLFIDSTEEAQIIINKQQEADLEDIENLWNATVDKNQVIKFTLQKLAIPEEQRRVHSSLMAKTAAALISGASMIPSFMGMNYGIQSASYATARLANNFINRQNHKNLEAQPLTDTEAIELANLIEELQDEIVISYYNYKNALNKLKNCREQMLLYNKNYSTALQNGDRLEIAVSSALWDEQVIEEYKLMQEVKKYQLILQRLAGKETIDNLNLVQYNLDLQNVKQEDLNFGQKKIKIQDEEEGKK